MPNVTNEVAKYIKEKGIRVSAISKQTGLSKDVLYNSLSGNRKLRVDEFLVICKFLETQPEYFFSQPEETSKAS